MDDIEVFFALMEEAALAAASYLLGIGRSVRAGEPGQVTSWRKDDRSLVTNLDIECDRIIRSRLGTILPVLTEEDSSTHQQLGSPGRYYVLDPIDGTTACRRFLTVEGGQVGFGPLIGIVEDGLLKAATFYNVPHRALFSAISGRGVSVLFDPALPLATFEKRARIALTREVPLSQCSVLFYVSREGEAQVIERLKDGGHIESFSRFGGFANDASRLALGLEDIQIQFAVKPWDLPGALFPAEAGMEVILDPLRNPTPLGQWKIQSNNPLVIVPRPLKDELMDLIRDLKPH